MEKKPSKQSFYMSQAGEGLKDLTEKIVGKKSAVLGQMLLNWKHIVGENYSTITVPLKLIYQNNKARGGILHLSVNSANAIEITQASPQIIDKINSFIGYNAISQIRLIHNASHSSRVTHQKTKAPLSKKQNELLDASISNIEDPRLRTVLQSFGRHIMTKEST